MHRNCSKCGFHYEIEPGFFYGAMYVSYAFSIAILIASGIVISFFVKEPSITFYAIFISIVSLIALPFSFRWSRLIWLYMFVRYEPDTEQTVNENLSQVGEK
jgi:hypothetical protein